MDEYIIISFDSVNFAMQAESVLKTNFISLQIIPTPREITLSCGLSIKTDVNNVNIIKQLVNKKSITIKEMLLFKGYGKSRKIEKLVLD